MKNTTPDLSTVPQSLLRFGQIFKVGKRLYCWECFNRLSEKTRKGMYARHMGPGPDQANCSCGKCGTKGYCSVIE